VLAVLLLEASSPVVLVPFAAGWIAVALAMGRLAIRTCRAADALDVLRRGAKRVPPWIAATAWGTLLSMLAIRM
jgi:hypothetical protein